MKLKTIALTLLTIISVNTGYTQVERSSELYRTIIEKDSLLFDVGFNTCDMAQFESLVSEDFEFYHDKGGSVFSKAEFIASIKSGICGLDYKATRKLDSSKMAIYPMYKNGVLYGAIQEGVHHFYATEENQSAYLTSIAKFTHVWMLENEMWKLSRSLSFDHNAIDKPINREILFKDKAETERWLKQKHIPALGIGYIEDGKIKQLSVFGELEKDREAPQNTIWNVASLTKPIVTMLTLQLVSNGDWDLDEPLFQYWIDPDVKDDLNHKKLTTRHVLSHQTGFNNWRWDDESADGKLKFQFEPGTQYQYSGEGFEYLKKGLENKFNLTLKELVDSLIFEPFEMNDTRFYWDNEMDESRFAKWHSSEGKQYLTDKTTEVSAADDLLTSLSDYTHFIAHILNGTGLSNTVQQEMVKEQARVNESKYWGLGFWIDEHINDNDDIALVHGGDDIGVHTIAFMIPATKQGLVIFTNSDNGTDAFLDVLLTYLGENGQGIINAEMK